ncbi:hypothetical protein H1C71_004289 [Ictidomys tridecemlineatus]|nr:hypothetical protein H1C71_004289 [Ictidomys tridecemlineatus]
MFNIFFSKYLWGIFKKRLRNLPWFEMISIAISPIGSQLIMNTFWGRASEHTLHEHVEWWNRAEPPLCLHLLFQILERHDVSGAASEYYNEIQKTVLLPPLEAVNISKRTDKSIPPHLLHI